MCVFNFTNNIWCACVRSLHLAPHMWCIYMLRIYRPRINLPYVSRARALPDSGYACTTRDMNMGRLRGSRWAPLCVNVCACDAFARSSYSPPPPFPNPHLCVCIGFFRDVVSSVNVHFTTMPHHNFVCACAAHRQSGRAAREHQERTNTTRNAKHGKIRAEHTP